MDYIYFGNEECDFDLSFSILPKLCRLMKSSAERITFTAMFTLVIYMSFPGTWVATADEEIAKRVGQEQVKRDVPATRQRPGQQPKETIFSPFLYEAIPDINSSASDFVPIPNRWNMLYSGKWYDPYNQNILKGDLPIYGAGGAHPWFIELSGISDSTFEMRKIPLPVGAVSTNHPGSNDIFGNGRQNIFVQNFIFSLSLYNGNTTFKPQEFEFRITPHISLNSVNGDEDGVLNVDPGHGSSRNDGHLGFDDLFAELHLANLSERYDFVSSRFGIQQFSSDFRGFIYNDRQPGVRFFGNYDNNIWQYNLAWFSRLDKDTNSGVNTFNSRHEQVLVANVYHQDLPLPGHTLQLSTIYRADNAGEYGQHYDDNGFLVRPAPIGDEREKNIYTTYIGINADGHIGRINDTAAFYYVTGSETHNQIAERQVDIQAQMAAFELSYDMDWLRFRTSFFWASGDKNPFDGRAQGFDAIYDSPNFAGGDLSFFQREGIPLIGGGGVNLVSPGSFLTSLRPGKNEGQSNFVNPGIRLYNFGIDVDVTPKVRWVNNFSFLQFDRPAVIRAVRHDGSINRDLGFDVSSGVIWRPFLNNNVQIRCGGAILIPGDGAKNLFKHDNLYDLFTSVILQY